MKKFSKKNKKQQIEARKLKMKQKIKNQQKINCLLGKQKLNNKILKNYNTSINLNL